MLHDQRVQVDHERSIVVTGTARHELKADEQRVTHGRRQAEVRQDDHLLVSGERHVRVSSQMLNASQQFHVSAGQQVVLEAGASVTPAGRWPLDQHWCRRDFQQRADRGRWGADGGDGGVSGFVGQCREIGPSGGASAFPGADPQLPRLGAVLRGV